MGAENLAELDCGVCGTKTAHQRNPAGVMACVPCTVRRDMVTAGAHAPAQAPTHIHVEGYRWTVGRVLAILLFIGFISIFVAAAVAKHGT